MARRGIYLDLTGNLKEKEPAKIYYEATSSWPLGTGYYGTVWCCRNENGLEVAVKYLKHNVGFNTPTGIQDQNAIKERYLNRLRREYSIWKDLHHQNIAPLIGYWINEALGGEMCLVTKLYQNGTVKWYSKEKPVATKLHLLCGAAKGLVYLHSKHIVHNDVKAANVAVDDEGVAVLIDFGVSFDLKTQNECTSSNKSEGRQWLAPERILWETYANGNTLPQTSADVWSFGCLLLEVMTEKVPWIRYRDGAYHTIPSVMLPEKQEIPGEEYEYPPMHDTLWKLCKEECWDYRADRRASMEYIYRKLKLLPTGLFA